MSEVLGLLGSPIFPYFYSFLLPLGILTVCPKFVPIDCLV